MVADNLYTTDASVKFVKTKTTSLSFRNSTGSVTHLDDLLDPVVMRMYPEILYNLQFTTVNLSTSSDLLLVQIKLNETGVTPLIILKPERTDTLIRYYVKIDSVPTVDNYDMQGVLSSKNSSYGADTDVYIVMVTNTHLQNKIQNTTSLPVILYVGFQIINESKNFVLNEISFFDNLVIN